MMQAAVSNGRTGLNLSAPPPELGLDRLQGTKDRLLADPAVALVLEHAGTVEAASIPGMLAQVEAYCRSCGDPVALRKRLVQVLLESLDNLCRHAKGVFGDSSFVLLVRCGDGYRLCTGNAVPAATGVLLLHRLGILNSMGHEDLREHYLKLLSNAGRTVNGGAGLGLMSMARKVVRPILGTVQSLGPFTSYLTFEMRLGADPDQDGPAAA
ncbi:MAG: hypothetical protein JST45_01345 [Bacteroidetes bacterium]|nr:hypothetical protein [Bacteroidota bacterium]